MNVSSDSRAIPVARSRPRFSLPVVTTLVFAIALAFYGSFADYGFNREDEGTLLTQFWRWSTGESPYTGFHMGYTPGVHFLHKTVMEWFGPGILPGRYLLAIINALACALLFLQTARLTSSWKWGLLGPFLYMAAVPVYAGEFAAFNIPYPVWYNVMLFTVTAALMPKLAADPGLGRLVVCGLLAGIGFTFKPNVGLFQLAATSMVCLLGCGRPRNLFEHVLWWAWWTSLLGGLMVVFWSAPTLREFLTFLGPPFVAAVALARDAYAKPARAGGPSLLACALVLGGGFLVVSLPWLAWSWSILGAEWFLRRALFLGTGFESVYYLSGPPIRIGSTVILASAAAWFLPRWLDRRGWPTWPLPVLGATMVCVAFVYLASTRPMPEGLYASVMKVVEPKVYLAAAFVQWALLLVWLTRPRDERAGRADLLGPAIICGVLLYLQIFPRTDFMHWVTAAPLLFPCAAWLLQSLTLRWSPPAGALARRAVGLSIVLPLVALASFRVGNFLDARWDWVDGRIERTPETVLRVPHAPVSINVGRAEQFRNLEATVDYIVEHTEPTEPVFTFPALDYVSYLSLRKPGNRHGYYFPGWPGHDTEAEVLVSLERTPPRLAITLYESQLYFASASTYYFLFADFFESRYRRIARRGPYAILAPADSAEPLVPDETAGPGPSLPVHPQAVAEAIGTSRMLDIFAALASPDANVRLEIARQMSNWRIMGDFAPLRMALTDPAPEVRSAAVHAIPVTRSTAVRDVLLDGVVNRSFDTGDSVLALRAIAATCDSSCVPKILDLLQGYEWDTAAAARGVVNDLPINRWRSDFWWKWEQNADEPFEPEVVDELVAALLEPDSDPQVRVLAYAFADLLGLARCPRAVRTWAGMRVRHVGPDFTVCLALHHMSRHQCKGAWLDTALRWLPLDGTLTARTVLREAKDDPVAADPILGRHANARFGAASALAHWICGMVGSNECLAAARATLAQSLDESERVAAAWSWSQLAPDDASIAELIAQAALDASPQVRETARYGVELRELRRQKTEATN
jgi:hypothetical protein